MKLAGYCFPACGVDSSLKITLLITDGRGPYCSGLIYRQETMLSKTSTISLYSFPKLIPLSKYHRQLECESGSLG